MCQLIPRHQKEPGYTLKQIDLFAAYVIPADAWYLIPAALLLEPRKVTSIMLSPVVPPVKKKSYCYESYKDAWSLLTKGRLELRRYSGNLGDGKGRHAR